MTSHGRPLRLVQSFVLPWTPTAKGRPRTVVRNGRPIVYTPNSTRNAEAAIRLLLIERKVHYYHRGLPVSLHVTFGLNRPNEAPRRELYPPRRPDLANYLMLLSDAGTGILWEDDSQLVMVEAQKLYTATPLVKLTCGVPMETGIPLHMLMAWERDVRLLETHMPGYP